MIYSPVLDWELMMADFAIEYTEMKKEENPHILSQRVKSHLADSSNHLKIYAYGSVLENEQAGAGFDIPEFKTEKKVSTQERKDLYLPHNQLHY